MLDRRTYTKDAVTMSQSNRPVAMVFIVFVLAAFLAFAQVVQAQSFSFTRIADNSTAMPGGGGNFTWLNAPSISGDSAAFSGINSNFTQGGIYAKSGESAVTLIANRSTAVPGGSGNFTGFLERPAISGANIAFLGFASSGCGERGIFSKLGTSALGLIANTCTAMPSNPNNFCHMGTPSMSGSAVSFWGQFCDNPGSCGSCSAANQRVGIFTTAGGLRRVADRTTAIPGGSGAFNPSHLEVFGQPIIAGMDTVFRGAGASEQEGFYHFDGEGSALSLIVDKNTMVPDALGNFVDFKNDGYDFDGTYLAYIDVDSTFGFPPTVHRAGVYLANVTTGQITTVADLDTPKPGTMQTFDPLTTNPGTPFLAAGVSGGNVLFYATDTSNTHTLYYFDMMTQSIARVIGTGDMLDGRTVTSVGIKLAGGAIMDGLRFGFLASFSDGTYGIYVGEITAPSCDPDETAPSIACPDDMMVSTDSGDCIASGLTIPTATASDTCGLESVTHDGPESFPLGDTVVTWTATDTSGNTATCTMTVTVIDDANPVIDDCPIDVSLPAEVGTCQAMVHWIEPSAGDNCGLDAFTSAHSPGESFPLGATTVTYTATDSSGNTATCSFAVTVVDEEAPAITTCPVDRSIPADANCQAVVPDVTGEVVASDACDESLAIGQSPAAGTLVELGDTTVTITATDASGNSSMCTLTITVTENGCQDEPVDDGEEPDPPFDGNNDGIPDDAQDHVSSVANENGDMVTIAAPDGTTLTDVQAGQNPSPGDVPEGVTFPAGFISFTVQGIAPGGTAEVQLILHASDGAAFTTYYKHGPTPDDTTPHWYEFLFDGATGVTSISGNVITMTLADGQRGDADLTANGTIVDPGAPAMAEPTAAPQPTADPNCGLCAGGAASSMFFAMVCMMTLKAAGRRRNRCRS